MAFAGPVLSTLMGAGIKLVANLVNNYLEQKKQDQMMLAARDEKIVNAVLKNQSEQANDPFVKITRRILFLSLTWTYCFLMIYYAMNNHIEYEVLVPKEGGFFGWIFGADSYKTYTLTGGLLLMSFVDLIFMVVGFYAIPSKRR